MHFRPKPFYTGKSITKPTSIEEFTLRKFAYLLLTALLFTLLTACGAAQEGVFEEEAAVLDNISTEIDTQLADDRQNTESTAVNETVADVDQPVAETVVDPIQPPAQPETASAELLATLPAFDESDVQETATGLQYVIYEEGSGETPVLGDTVVAHYTGYLADGTQFDSSRDRGATFDFPIGRGAVIPGWDQGFALMTPWHQSTSHHSVPTCLRPCWTRHNSP